jgi:hypothetical protein
MPAEAEYFVFEGPYTQLQVKLDELAGQGYRPILMSSFATGIGIITTVILQHTLVYE